MWTKCVWLFLAVLIIMQANTGATAAQQPTANNQALYQNPINLGNMGDPYVFRWNGRYYLYPTVGGQGLRTWISTDLVNWKPAGYVAQEPVARGAYAPEVVYWNGTFYMYISRDQDGHYVLKSDSPTGPFLQQTKSLGLNIDGSVFFDNDGEWYFTHAAGRGIRGHKMADPYKIGAELRLNADLLGWTEGPGILQRNGYYFLTYTGNHFLSKGYRVNYAVSEQGPLGPYEVPDNNPIIISTDDFSGLGHNSNVIGPDLDSYYMAYHNRQTNYGSAIRLLNIDRVVFNGKKMAVLGPTNWRQQTPKMADFYTWIDENGLGDRWTQTTHDSLNLLVSNENTAANYTAEFNFQVQNQPTQPGALIGAVVCYQDATNFVYAGVDIAGRTLTAVAIRNEQSSVLGKAQLPSDFDFTKLHTIRVEKNGDRAEIFFDTMRKLNVKLGAVAGGRIGYVHRDVNPVFRYTAFNNDVAGSSEYDVYKPIPGDIEAVHYLKVDGHHVAVPNTGNPLRSDDATLISKTADQTYAVELASKGDWLRYNINVEKAGLYGVDFSIKTSASTATVELLVDDTVAQTLTIPAAQYVNQKGMQKVRAGFVSLPSGFHTLSVRLSEGSLAFQTMSLYQATLDAFSVVDPLTRGVVGSWGYFGAPKWISTEQGYRLAGQGNSMVVMGNPTWTDYTVEADVKLDSSAAVGEVGLLLRATNVSYYETQVVDAMMGYYVAINGQQLSLKRLNYSSQTLQTVDIESQPGEYERLRVVVVAGNIKVYLGDSKRALIDYTDANTFMYGAVGFRANRNDAVLRNFAAQCAACSVYGEVQVGDRSFWVQPHTSNLEIVLPFSATEVPPVEVLPVDALQGEAVQVEALQANALPLGQQSVRLLDPTLRLVATAPSTIPGRAQVQVLRPDNSVVHTVDIDIKKDTTPTVSLRMRNKETSTPSLSGKLSGKVWFDIGVNGPGALLRSGSVVLQSIPLDGNGETIELFSGAGLPQELPLDTLQLTDGAYRLVAKVESIYDTSVQTTLEFIVQNWNEEVDEMQPPSNSFFGLLNFDKTVERSGGWAYAADESEQFFADADRLALTSQSEHYLVWQAPELREFAITLYSHSESISRQVVVAASTDNATWTAVPYTVQVLGASSTGWRQLRVFGAVPEGQHTQFLKLSITPPKGMPTDIQVGRAVLRSLVSE